MSSYSSSQYINEKWEISEDFKPPVFNSWEEVEAMTSEEAQGIFIYVGKWLGLELTRQFTTHFHPLDDCGDDLDHATLIWSRIHAVWFGNDGFGPGNENTLPMVEALREIVDVDFDGWLPEPLWDILPFAHDND